jgi:hypothetical protein
MLNGQVVGVSKGFFGGHVLSGNVPLGLSPQQHQQIVDSLLGLQNKGGAYTTYVGEDGIPNQETYDPSFTYGGQGKYSSEYSSPATPVTSSAKNYVGTTAYSPAGYDYSPTGYEPSNTTGGSSSGFNDSAGFGGGSYNDDGTDRGSNEYSGGRETSGDAISDAMNDDDNFGLSKGGRVGYAPGGRADGPGSESEGHSSHGFDGGRSDAGGNDGGNDNDDRESIAREIQARISNVVQNQPMTPEERFASNAAMIDKTPDLKP